MIQRTMATLSSLWASQSSGRKASVRRSTMGDDNIITENAGFPMTTLDELRWPEWRFTPCSWQFLSRRVVRVELFTPCSRQLLSHQEPTLVEKGDDEEETEAICENDSAFRSRRAIVLRPNVSLASLVIRRLLSSILYDSYWQLVL